VIGARLKRDDGAADARRFGRVAQRFDRHLTREPFGRTLLRRPRSGAFEFHDYCSCSLCRDALGRIRIRSLRRREMLTEEVGDLVERDLVQPIIEIDVVGARDDHKLFRLRRSWATEHGDSDFWYHCRTMGIPDSLAEKVEL
jgi:hypothetical protein